MLLVLLGAAAGAPPAQAAVTPIAYEDAYAAPEGDVVDISAPGVLENDFGVGSDYRAKLTTDVLGPATLDFHGDGSFTFDPHDWGAGEIDFFYCIASRATGDCVGDPVVVRMFNGEPYVPNHSYATVQGTVLDVPSPGLLKGAQNRTSGDYLYVTRPPDVGTLDAHQNGSFTYSAPSDFIGTVTFGYCISNDADVPDCEGFYDMTGSVAVYPNATGSSFSVLENSSYQGQLYPAPAGGITFAGLITAAPQHGSVDVNNDGSFTYAPTPGYSGPDQFQFCISQDEIQCLAGSAAATVGVTVTPLDVPTTLTLNAPATAAYTQPVAVTATLAPADAAGTVAFTDNGSPVGGCSAVVVTSGTARCTPPTLTVGTHVFTAAFTGAGNYLDSTGGPATTLVGKAPTALTYTGATAAATGQNFTASATLVNALSGTPLAGHTVSFAVPGDTCQATTTGAGAAGCALQAPAPGPATVTVTYAGAPNYQPATTTGTVTVRKLTTTTGVTVSPSSALWGTPVTVHALVDTEDGSAATGTVAFRFGGAPLTGCGAVPVTNGAADCDVTGGLLPVGADQITATYSGDATHAGSSGQGTVTLAKRPTSLNYTGAGDAVVGVPSTLSAVLTDATSGDPLPGATIAFTRGPLTCSDTTDAAGIASCDVTPTAVSQTGTVTAAYTGDDNHGSAQATSQLTVAPAATTTTLNAPATAVFTTPVVLTATVSPTDGTGTVGFASAGTPIAGCDAVPLTHTGGEWQATCTTSALPVGVDALTAVYSGTPDYVGSSGSTTVTIGPAPTALMYTGETTGTVTKSITVAAVLVNTAASPAPVAGQTLTFTLADLSCSAETGTDGAASCELPLTDVAQAGVLTVTYAATTDYQASATTEDITVSPVATTTVVTAPSDATFSVPVTVTATVDPSAGAGTVTFTTAGEPLAGCANLALNDVAGAWQAACATAALPVGDNTVTAHYSGTPSYLASDAAADITVHTAPTTLEYTGSTSATVGEPFTATAVLTVAEPSAQPANARSARRLAAAAPIPAPGQPVTFSLGSLSCRATTDPTGTATCAITPTAVAQAGELVASFAGNEQYLAAQASADVSVARAPTAIRVSSSAARLVAGAAVTFTATVDPTDGGGDVTFRHGGTVLCESVALASSTGHWVARCTTSALPVGTDTVTALYSGDDNYLAARATTTVTTSAEPPAAAPSSSDGSGSGTAPAVTGVDAAGLAGVGGLLLLAGATATMAARRRR